VGLTVLLENFGVHGEDHSERCGRCSIGYRKVITVVFYADNPRWRSLVRRWLSRLEAHIRAYVGVYAPIRRILVQDRHLGFGFETLT
jgi:hypothetical protein